MSRRSVGAGIPLEVRVRATKLSDVASLAVVQLGGRSDMRIACCQDGCEPAAFGSIAEGERKLEMTTYRATSPTVACTLSAEELRDTRSAWEKLLRASLVLREEIPGGLRLVVNDGSAPALSALIEIERECCPWITFELDGPAVSMTAEGEGAAALRSTWASAPASEA